MEQPVQRLRLADLGPNLDVDPACFIGLAHPRHLLAGLHGDALILRSDLVVGGTEVLGCGDRTQRKIEAYGLLRLGTEPIDERVDVLAGGRQELLDVDALGGELAGGPLHAPAQVRVHQCVWRLDVGELHQLLRGPADQLAPGAVQLGVGEPATDAAGPFGDIVEFADVLGHPVVGELRGDELLDSRDLDRDVDWLGGALRCRGERTLVARGDADELVVEVVGDPPLTDLIGPVVGIESGDRLAVSRRRKIDDDVVADRRLTIDVAERPEPLQLCGDLGVDLLFGDGDRRQLDPQAPVARDRDLGANLEGGVDDDWPFLAPAGDLHLGRVDDVDVVFTHRLGQVLGDGIVERLLAGRGEADPRFEHPAGHLSGAEAG